MWHIARFALLVGGTGLVFKLRPWRFLRIWFRRA
jgi:hypothetical protein